MTYRSDVNSISTNRLIKENDLLNSKYNQFKKNFSVTSKSDFMTNNNLDNLFLSQQITTHNTPERDNEDNDKYNILRKVYDERIKSLYNNYKILAMKFESDDILQTMKNDSISNEFIHQRMKELIDENMTNEKEEFMRKIMEELSDLKSKFPVKDKIINDLNQRIKFLSEENDGKVKHFENMFSDAFQKNNALQAEINCLNNEINKTRKHYELELNKMNEDYMMKLTKQANELQKYRKDSNLAIDHMQYSEEKLRELLRDNEELKLEMDRLQKVISVLEIDLNNNESKLKEKQTKIDSYQVELSSLQTQIFETNLKHKKIIEENKSLSLLLDHNEKERKSLYDKYNSFNEELQISENEKIQSLDKKYKEKQNILKKKVIEVKNTIHKLEEELKTEKNNTLNTKISYSKLITTMQEDMKLIKNEWEKKCKQQESDFEMAISELENKHLIEINHIKNDNEIEIEKKIKEIQKLKADSETLKNFEREYIKLSKHDEIVNEKLSELRKKITNEMKVYEEDIDKEFKKKLVKLEEDKKAEFDFLTDNLRKNLKSSEKYVEDYKNYIFELETKLKKERDNNDKLNEIIENLHKNIKSLTKQLEEELDNVKILKDKILSYEDKLKNVSNSNYSYQETMDSMMSKIHSLEKERQSLIDDLRSKEDYYKVEINRFEKTFLDFKDTQNKKLENESELSQNLKLKISQLESFLDECKNENYLYDKKNSEMQKQIQFLEESIENYNNKLKSYEDENINFEKRVYDLEKTNKKLNFEKKNSNELLITLIRSKLNSFRSEISNIKSYASNEINNIKKESFKLIETVMNKIKVFKVSNDKSIEIAVKDQKEQIEKEYLRKCDQKEKELNNEVTKISQKYEKHLLEQFKINEKLEKDCKSITDQNQSNILKNRELQFNIQELDQEIKKLNNIINNLKKDIDNYIESINKLKQDKNMVLKLKSENEELEDMSKKEVIKKFQASLATILSMVNKTKKKYQNEIFQSRVEMEKLNHIIENEIKGSDQQYKSILDNFENLLYEEKELSRKFKEQYESKESEMQNIKKDIEKLKEIYENKIELLQTKMTSDKGRINDIKNELKTKHNQIKDLTQINQDFKSQQKTLKTQLEMKNEEINNYKKEFEKLFNLKEKKITDLQNVISQSYLSYNNGINNIKIANKLDDEIKNLVKKLKIDEKDYYGDNITYESLNESVKREENELSRLKKNSKFS